MKNQNKRIEYQRFMLRNNNINYLDKSKIIQQFNSSISLYKRFASVLEAGDDELAAKKLHDAGTSLYQCVEWSLKNYLYKRYQELEAEALIGTMLNIFRYGYMTTCRNG